MLLLHASILGAEPARIAILGSDATAREGAELLTAVLSKNPLLALVERTEIDRLIREQGLSATGKDALKLGRLLRAEGLVLLEVLRVGTNHVLATRVIAVEPGVVLAARHDSVPMVDPDGWAGIAARTIAPLLPKLRVPLSEAVPLSILTIKSALQSRQAETLEKELTLLTIERLSGERRVFVMERGRMDVLTAEKELTEGPGSGFWDGRYVLECTLNRDGNVQGQIALSAKLVALKGGASASFEISGSSTNVLDAIERLAAETVKRLPASGGGGSTWTAGQEANRFHDDAVWALKWNQLREARAAADAAWYLGRRDAICASNRITAYVRSTLLETPSDAGGFVRSDFKFWTGLEGVMKQEIARIPKLRRQGVMTLLNWARIDYAFCPMPVTKDELDMALRSLELFEEGADLFAGREIEALSGWHNLGVSALEAAARVLQQAYCRTEDQGHNSESLADLRAACRHLADRLLKAPSMRRLYWLGDTDSGTKITNVQFRPIPAAFDSPIRQGFWLTSRSGLPGCITTWGSFWQETPEDCAAMYADLMTSPFFCHTQRFLRERSPQSPRIVAWKPEDRSRTEGVWNRFVDDAMRSTNFLTQLEGLALRGGTTANPRVVEQTFPELWKRLVENRDLVVGCEADVLAAEWLGDWGSFAETGDLVGRVELGLKGKLEKEYGPVLSQIRREWESASKSRESARWEARRFEALKATLTPGRAFDLGRFGGLYGANALVPSNATQLLPLVLAYRSNLVARPGNEATQDLPQRTNTLAWLGKVERELRQALAPPGATPPTQRRVVDISTMPYLNPLRARATPTNVQVSTTPHLTRVVSNVLVASDYVRMPREWFPAQLDAGSPGLVNCQSAGKDFWFGLCPVHQKPSSAGLIGESVLWEGSTAQWRRFPYPVDRLPRSSAFHNGSVWVIAGWMERIDGRPAPATSEAGGRPKPTQAQLHADPDYRRSEEVEIRRFDLTNNRWDPTPLEHLRIASLFSVNGRLYAAGRESILELEDNGRTIRVLASCRRRPAASALDSMAELGMPILQAGPSGSLVATTAQGVYQWDGRDWHQTWTADRVTGGERRNGGVVLRCRQGANMQLWLLRPGTSHPELCLSGPLNPARSPGYVPVMGTNAFRGISGGAMAPRFPQPERASTPAPNQNPAAGQPLWDAEDPRGLVEAPVEVDDTGVLLLDTLQPYISGTPRHRPTFAEEGGRHLDLLCLRRGTPIPIRVPIRFDLTGEYAHRDPSDLRIRFYGYTDPFWLAATPDFLAIGIAPFDGFFRISRSELESFVKLDLEALNAREERKRAILNSAPYGTTSR